MNIKHYIARGLMAMVMVPMLSSCNDWLQVDQEDSILETTLFNSNEGYQTALNGVYAKLNTNYGSMLSMGAIDVLAQLYNVRQNTEHAYVSYATYKYDQLDNASGNLWTTQYNLIANLNTLLEHADDSSSKLSGTYRSYIKGEALALRAFLHFDLLRLYGPIYSDATKSQKILPYQETTSKEIQPMLTAEEIMNKVFRDLKEAAALLEKDDVRTKGAMNGTSDDVNEGTFFRYRQYRLNYFAVQALLARAYLWVGDKANAYQTAKAIIAESDENQVFPWTSKNAVVADVPDRLFSTEVIFSLYNQSRMGLYDSNFNHTTNYNSLLSFKGESMAEGDASSKLSYFYDDMNDIRRVYFWTQEEVEKRDNEGNVQGAYSVLCFNKYASVNSTATKYMIPLIRMSEIYLIAAECTDNLEEAIGYVNTIRAQRSCADLVLTAEDSKEKVKEYITNEFAREVIGEGQLFFYYKRNAMERIASGVAFGDDGDGTEPMNLADYVWPLPKVETDKRGQSK